MTSSLDTPLRSRLKDHYETSVVPALITEFDYVNRMQVPRMQKIVVNIGVGDALDNPRALAAAQRDLTTITGQKPIVRNARKSIAGFKLREGKIRYSKSCNTLG